MDINNLFKQGVQAFLDKDPHLTALSKYRYQYSSDWWNELPLQEPGIYMLTGGRQIGKSTSCKLLIKHCLQKKIFNKHQIQYVACDEIFDAKQLSETLRDFLQALSDEKFLLIIDEVTFVKYWDRVIKALADEGWFREGVCLLTGSDTVMLKEAAMSFPGRRGEADQVDFHLYPLSFNQYVELIEAKDGASDLKTHFNNFLKTGGYLRAINDLGSHGRVLPATFKTYEQWVRGDFLKNGKSEEYLLSVLQALMIVGVSQISYSSLTQKIGLLSKETCIQYCDLLKRMDILIDFQALDINKRQGFPRKARKFHFTDPFIYRVLHAWLQRENRFFQEIDESIVVESCVSSHLARQFKAFYFKGSQGEVDAMYFDRNKLFAIEVKWANQVRPADLKTLKQFENSKILTKSQSGWIENINAQAVCDYLNELSKKFGN